MPRKSSGRKSAMPVKARSARQTSVLKELDTRVHKDELIRRLKAVSEFVASNTPSKQTDKELNKHATSLVKPSLLRHKDKAVAINVACTLADILKFYAPHFPYDGHQLQSILQQFVHQLKGLKQIESPLYPMYFTLLEACAMSKCFNQSVLLEDHDTVVDVFRTFFGVIRADHTSQVVSLMERILVELMDKEDLNLSDALLDTIFACVLPNAKEENPGSFALAKGIIAHASSSMRVEKYFDGLLGILPQSESKLKPKGFQLIATLADMDDRILTRIVPHFEHLLRMDDATRRLEAVRILAIVFSKKDSVMAHQHGALWQLWLKRFTDTNHDIRQTCVQSSLKILQHHSDLADAVFEKLDMRLHDPHEKTREDAVRVVGKAAATLGFDMIPKPVFEKFCGRRLDKEAAVRYRTFMHLAVAIDSNFSRLAAQRDTFPDTEDSQATAGDDSVSEQAQRVTAMLSFACREFMSSYTRAEQAMRYRLELFLHEIVLKAGLTPKERADRLHFLCQDDAKVLLAITTIPKRKASVRQKVQALFCSDEDDTAQQATLLALLPIERAKAFEAIQLLRSCRVKAFQQQLKQFLTAMPTDLNDLMESYESLKSKCPESLRSVLSHLLIRSMPFPLDSACVVALLNNIRDSAAEELDASSYLPALALVEACSQTQPNSFCSRQSVSALSACLSHEKTPFVVACLKVLRVLLPNASMLTAADNRKMRAQLTAMVASTQVPVAKRAVTALCTMENCDTQVAQAAEECASNLSVEFDENERLLPSLKALSYIALLKPDCFADVDSQVLQFVVKSLLMNVANPSDVDEDEEDVVEWLPEMSTECQAKVLGIKLLVRRIVGRNKHEDLDEMELEPLVRPTIRLLTAVLENYGRVKSNDQTPPEDQSRLRLAAGCALLKLAEHTRLRPFVTPYLFRQLGLIMQDSCIEVRRTFCEKLHKGLQPPTPPLPQHYLSLFVLSAIDTKACAEKASSHLTWHINLRRQVALNMSEEARFSHLPEHIVPHAVHLLAHHNFALDDMQALGDTERYLNFLFNALCSKSHDNLSLLLGIVNAIKTSEDHETPDESENIYAVCDVAQMILNYKMSQPGFVPHEFPGDILLPTSLYQQASTALNPDQRYVPAEFHLTLPRVKVSKPRTPGSAGKRKSRSASATPKKVKASTPATPQSPLRRNASRRAKAKINSMADMEDDEMDRQMILDDSMDISTSGRASKSASAMLTDSDDDSSSDVPVRRVSNLSPSFVKY
eukprot:m.126526 g.126526  ORF g.126526 m.126526 type:complete len:1245 (+) comp13834_c0_seq2:174-3908(+)